MPDSKTEKQKLNPTMKVIVTCRQFLPDGSLGPRVHDTGKVNPTLAIAATASDSRQASKSRKVSR